jgi:mRNA interferase HicA
MKRRDLLAHLTAHGCALLREGAPHSWWHNVALNKRRRAHRGQRSSGTEDLS